MTRVTRPGRGRQASLGVLVRRAQPLARTIVAGGLEVIAGSADRVEGDLFARLEDLLGRDPLSHVDDDALRDVREATEAALAIGIAVGLLLRPDAFPARGPR